MTGVARRPACPRAARRRYLPVASSACLTASSCRPARARGWPRCTPPVRGTSAPSTAGRPARCSGGPCCAASRERTWSWPGSPPRSSRPSRSARSRSAPAWPGPGAASSCWKRRSPRPAARWPGPGRGGCSAPSARTPGRGWPSRRPCRRRARRLRPVAGWTGTCRRSSGARPVVPSASPGRPPGSGLGLAIVNAVAAAHKGTAQASLNDPHGLRITLALPASGPASAEPAAPVPHTVSAPR